MGVTRSVADTVRIDDLAAPRLTPELKAAIASASAVGMNVDAVLEAARLATGLADFGAPDFRERLEIWLKSFDDDTSLNALGRADLFADCVAKNAA